MSEQKSITAQSNYSQAVALHLNHTFKPQGVTAIAWQQDNQLLVALVSHQLPEPLSAIDFIREQTRHLSSISIHSITITAHELGESEPAWTQEIEVSTRSSHGLSDPSHPLQKLKKLGEEGIRSYFDRAILTPADFREDKPQDFWIFLGVVGMLVGLGGQFYNQWLLARPPITPLPPAPASSAWFLSLSLLKSLPEPTVRSLPLPVSLPSRLDWNTLEKQVTGKITLKAVGDIVPGTDFPDRRLPDNPNQLFQAIRPYLKGSDLLFGNFESTLTTYSWSAKDTSQSMVFAFRTPPEYARLLKQAGFNVLSIANNHANDFSTEGFQDTAYHLKQAGMAAVGQKYQILYQQVRGISVAFIGFSYLEDHNQVQDLKAAAALVQQARKQAQIVVVSMHAGAEGSDALEVPNGTELFFGEDRGNKRAFAHAVIDQGADLVLGHGPHVPRALELYKGKLIAYSLGNFLGYETLSTEGTLGQSLILEIELDFQGNFVKGQIIPVQLNELGIPQYDPQRHSIELLRQLTRSNFPQTPLNIDRQGRVTVVRDGL